MRLGRVPLLGIDYGPFPGSELTSDGAKWYAKKGDLKAAYAWETLCDLVKDTPDESDGLYYSWSQQVQTALRTFGSDAPEIMEAIQIECDPTYNQGELEVPAAPIRQTPPPAYMQAKGMTADSQYSWNKGAPVATQGRQPTIPTLPFGSLFKPGSTAAPLTMSPAASYGSYS